MRSKNATKNLAFLLVYEMLAFACGIIFPRFIILIYGSQINGLTSTITRILSLINLIQAGAVGAAIFQMYQPVATNDFERQSAIIFSSRKYYNRISFIFLIISLSIGLFYSFYLSDKVLSPFAIFFSFLILSINGAGILLFNSVCDIFLSPHQKKYLLTTASICELVVRYLLMSVVLILHLNFVFIYVCYLAGGIVSILINQRIYKKYSYGIINGSPNDKAFPIPDRRYLMLSSVGSEIVTASPIIIISTFSGLIASSIFSVYAMIFTSMKTILNSIQLSFSAIFGNLVKTSSNHRIYDVYSTIELFTIIIGTIASSCVGFLIVPFIKLYTVGADTNYVYIVLALFVVLYTLIFTFRTAFGYVATVYGLFKETCKIIITFGITGVLLSFLFVLFFGMPYVMVGIIFNELGCAITTLLIIKKRVSWFKCDKLLIRSLIMFFLVTLSVITYFVAQPIIDSWAEWIAFAFLIVLIIILLLAIYCAAFERKYLKMFRIYANNIFKRRKNK